MVHYRPLILHICIFWHALKNSLGCEYITSLLEMWTKPGNLLPHVVDVPKSKTILE